MKIKRKKPLTLGDLIAAAYEVWGVGHAAKMLRWAMTSRRIVVRKSARTFISFPKGRHA
jgi:hypothetical protein